MATIEPAPRGLSKAFALCALAYVLALGAGGAVGYSFRHFHPLVMLVYADIAATLVIYLSGRIFRNASFYDPYWSVAPLAIALYWVVGGSPHDAAAARQIIVITLVFAWGLRLTYNWARKWRGLKHEDWRYRDLRRKSGGWFWLVDLAGIELMPTVMVFLGCLSLYPALATGTHPFGILDAVAFTVTAGAIIIETAADEQLRKFTRKNRSPGEIMEEGLWRYSRHPNYFGEVMFWWGLYIFALAAGPGYWWTVAGPAAITVLFAFISIPMMDKRSLARRPGYLEHISRTSAFLPWFPGEKKSEVKYPG